jgi:hypothetical protein
MIWGFIEWTVQEEVERNNGATLSNLVTGRIRVHEHLARLQGWLALLSTYITRNAFSRAEAARQLPAHISAGSGRT